MYGSHALLTELPIWATAIGLYFVLNVPIQVLRDWKEGLPYQVSYSAMFGDAALVTVALIAATILQRSEFIPELPKEYHWGGLFLGLVVGITWVIVDPPSQLGDRYHHLAVVPLLVYLAITLLPVIYRGGTNVELVATICLALLWAGLVVFDFKYERMAQRPWLQRIGVEFKN